jgi:hypothetical protein
MIESTKEFINFFGIKFLVFVSAIIHVLKGFVFGSGQFGIVGLPIIFILRDYGYLSAIRIQVLKTLPLLPFALKPLFGVLSDIVSINGYNKIYYMMITLVISSISSILITVFWTNVLSPELLCLLLFLIYVSIAVNDLLTEAKYSEKIKENPEKGPNFISFVLYGIFIGEILSILITGSMMNDKRILYLIAAIPLMICIIPIYLNWCEDKKINNNFICIDYTHLLGDWKLNLLSCLICILSLIMGILGFLNIPIHYLFLFSLICSIFMILGFSLFTSPVFAKIQSYVIIQNMFTVSIEAGTFFFFTDPESIFPGGPHFSTFFYVTVIGITSAVFGFLGIITYNLFMKQWNYRSIFWITNILYMLVNLLNIIIFKRLNLDWGIPDKWFILGAESFQHIIGVWNYLPHMLLMSHLSYEGREATCFAILAGSSNLGSGLSQIQGAYLLYLLNINPNGGINDFMSFDNLWIASLISAVLPCIPLFLIQYLIPNKNQDDKIIDE